MQNPRSNNLADKVISRGVTTRELLSTAPLKFYMVNIFMGGSPRHEICSQFSFWSFKSISSVSAGELGTDDLRTKDSQRAEVRK